MASLLALLLAAALVLHHPYPVSAVRDSQHELQHPATDATQSSPKEDAASQGPLHVYRDAAGNLVAEPERLPSTNAGVDPHSQAAFANELDALYLNEAAAVRTRKTTPRKMPAGVRRTLRSQSSNRGKDLPSSGVHRVDAHLTQGSRRVSASNGL